MTSNQKKQEKNKKKKSQKKDKPNIITKEKPKIIDKTLKKPKKIKKFQQIAGDINLKSLLREQVISSPSLEKTQISSSFAQPTDLEEQVKRDSPSPTNTENQEDFKYSTGEENNNPKYTEVKEYSTIQAQKASAFADKDQDFVSSMTSKVERKSHESVMGTIPSNIEKYTVADSFEEPKPDDQNSLPTQKIKYKPSSY